MKYVHIVLIATMLYGISNVYAYSNAKYSNNHLYSFTSDGCSKSPDGTLFTPDKWLSCCVVHDVWYWIGGTSQEREYADDELYQCIREIHNDDTATIYYWTVRMFGGPYFDSSFRWGYGWDKMRPYRNLSPAEINIRNDLRNQVLSTTDYSAWLVLPQ